MEYPLPVLRTAPLLSFALVLGCPSEVPSTDEPPTESPTDGPFVPGPWQTSQPELTGDDDSVRAIVHLHSHWSHDACDGDPQPGGVPDEACLADLRAGLCETRIDVAFLSDHPTHVDETDYATLLLARTDDEPATDADGNVVGTRMTCESGHQVLLLPGVESGDMMPLALDVTMDSYSGDTAEDFDRITEAGGLRWIAHTETRDVEHLGTLGLEGIELYQLHANLAPDLREDYLGLDPYSYLGEVGPFFFPDTQGLVDPPHPDLAPLGFVSLNEPSMVALETLGQDGRIAISGGTDAHQNVFPADASDGERIDSYRRMMRWFHTRLLMPNEGSIEPDAAEAALREARSMVVFEVFGTPTPMRVEIMDGSSALGGLGDEVPWASGQTVGITPPTLDPRSPRSEDDPTITTRVYFADATGRTLLAESDDDAMLSVEVPGPGVLRAEVWITPRHLAPYLGEVAETYLETPVPWIQTGGVFFR